MPANLHTLSSLGSIPDAAPTVLTDLREFLAFKIGNEEYGVDILRVQEIRSYEKPTTIATAAADLKGVVNLRGVIVPIIDLRLKLGLPEARYDHLTVVIVLNIGQRVVGVVVDGVSDVLTLEREQLRPVPALDMDVDRDHLLAIGSVDDLKATLADIAEKKKLIDTDQLALEKTAVTTTEKTEYAALVQALGTFWQIAGQNIQLIEQGNKEEGFDFLVAKTIPARNVVLEMLSQQKQRQNTSLTESC